MSEDQNLDPVEGEEAVEVPAWVPEKFRSNPEKFAEAYTNLEREFHSSRQQIKGLEEAIQTQASQFEEMVAQQNRPDPNAVNEYWANQYEVDPLGTMAQIAASTAQQILQQQASQNQPVGTSPDVVAFMADQTMGQQYDDWGSYKEKVSEVIAQNPLFQRDELWNDPRSAATALESAYRMVKADDVLSGAAEAVQQQMADTRAMKLGAQTATGASGRPPAPSDAAAEWERIRNAGPQPYWAGPKK